MPSGRPTIYTESLGRKICEFVADGDSAREAARKCGIDEILIRNWRKNNNLLIDNEPFSSHYARAIEDRAQAFFERGNDIAMTIKDGEGANIARVQLDWLKWSCCRLHPKVFGDKLAHTGEDGGAIQVEFRAKSILEESK